MTWTWIEVEEPQVGDWALHKSNTLDAREVVQVSENGEDIWIQIGDTLPPTGPLSARNYTYSRRMP
jgi:hypothetical protein